MRGEAGCSCVSPLSVTGEVGGRGRFAALACPGRVGIGPSRCVQWPRPFMMVWRAEGRATGVYFCRNFLFRSVILPQPSNFYDVLIKLPHF